MEQTKGEGMVKNQACYTVLLYHDYDDPEVKGERSEVAFTDQEGNRGQGTQGGKEKRTESESEYVTAKSMSDDDAMWF